MKKVVPKIDRTNLDCLTVYASCFFLLVTFYLVMLQCQVAYVMVQMLIVRFVQNNFRHFHLMLFYQHDVMENLFVKKLLLNQMDYTEDFLLVHE
jgi:hypothetical protein